jgi:type I restriction enzyme S subunit
VSENGARPKLPEDWEWSTLGAVCEKPQYGYTTKASPTGSLQFLRTTDISSGRLNWATVPFCSELPDDVAKYKLNAGDIVIARSGSVGLNWLLEDPVPDAVFASYLIRFRPKPTIDPHYLRLCLQAPLYWDYVGRLATGTGMNNINAQKLASIPVPVPPLKEQRRIVSEVADCLTGLDQASEPLTRSLGLLKMMRASLLQQAVAVGELTTVGSLLRGIEGGKSFRCHGHPAPPDRWGVLKVSAMTWGEFREGENKEVLDSSQVDERWEVRQADLLISRANTSEYVGATVYVERTRPNLLLSDKSLRLIPDPERVDPEWLFYAMNAPRSREQMSKTATGTSDSMRNLSQDKIKSVELRVPNIEDQREIVLAIKRQLGAVGVLSQAVTAQKAAAASARRSVLGAAMRGQLNLSGSENPVAGPEVP